MLCSPAVWGHKTCPAISGFIEIQKISIRSQCADIILPWIECDLETYCKESADRVRPEVACGDDLS